MMLHQTHVLSSQNQLFPYQSGYRLTIETLESSIDLWEPSPDGT